MKPNQHYRYSFKKGMYGWDVQALQISLNNNHYINPLLVEDGVFVTKTEVAVLELQQSLKITADGIAGPETQSALCSHQCHYAQHTYAPNGLLKGICLGESGGIIPATSALYANGSRDYGPFQNNMTNPTQSQLHNAYNIAYESDRIAKSLYSNYKIYLGQPGALNDEQAWKLAVLNYNWPAAAAQIAAGNKNTWVYTSAGIQYKLSDPAPWVERIGIAGVKTGLDWCNFYVDGKIVYVTSWTI
jgi:hypothetical protein